jgi:hypothetical protein
MRILFLTSRMPSPPVGGDRHRVYHILRTAAEAGHRIDLVTFDDGRSDPGAIEPLRRLTSSVEVVTMPKLASWWMAARALPGRTPLQAAYYRSDEMSRRVARAFDETSPDAVYTHLFRMAPYALAEQPRRDAPARYRFAGASSSGSIASRAAASRATNPTSPRDSTSAGSSARRRPGRSRGSHRGRASAWCRSASSPSAA